MNTNTKEITPGYNCRKCHETITIPEDGLPRELGAVTEHNCSQCDCDAMFYVSWSPVLENNLVTYEVHVSFE